MFNEILLGGSVFTQSLARTICILLLLKNSRFSRKISFCILFIPIAAVNFVHTFMDFQSWQTVVIYAVHLIMVIGMFKEPFREKLFLFCILYSVDVIIEAVGFIFFDTGIVYHDPTSDVNILQKALVGYCGSAAMVLWVLLFVRLRRLWEPSVYWKFYIFALGQFVVEVAAMEAVYMNHMGQGDPVRLIFSAETLWPYRLGIAAFLLVTGLMYFILFFSMRQEQYRRRLELKLGMMEKNMAYYQKIEADMEHLRKFRHDAANHLSLVKNLLEEDPGAAERYLEELRQKITDTLC